MPNPNVTSPVFFAPPCINTYILAYIHAYIIHTNTHTLTYLTVGHVSQLVKALRRPKDLVDDELLLRKP